MFFAPRVVMDFYVGRVNGRVMQNTEDLSDFAQINRIEEI